MRRLNHAISMLAASLSIFIGFLLSTQARAITAPGGDNGQTTISAGTVVTVQMIDAVDSAHNHVGENFAATVAAPVVVGDKVVIPKGAEATVRLIESKAAGRIKGRSELELQLVKLTVGGTTYSVESSLYTKAGNSRTKRSGEVIGGGAGLAGISHQKIDKGCPLMA